jgi:programmed cell death protein 4
MADFSKRPEVTVDTMGKVHNPSGEGVKAISSSVKTKAAKKASQPPVPVVESHDTKVKEEGSSRRNITRKKTEGVYDSRNKKQGGHGKGKWDDLQDGSEHDALKLDKDDPLYDESEDTEAYILTSGVTEDVTGYDEVVEKQVYGPMLTLTEFKLQVADIVREYFDSADSDEVIRSLEEMKCRPYLPEVVKKAISLSLDEGPRERELVSRLLTCLHPTPLSDEDMAAGFDLLLGSLEDLCIDCPDAKPMVGSFLARAVVDEVLPPAFLSTQNNENPGSEVVEKAVSLLSREHCTARLEKIWGPGDGRPVAELKKVMDQLLQEYLLSRELDEAARCVRELKAAHFHHELVKRGVKIAMEQDGSQENSQENLDAMVALFSFLVKNSIMSEYQVAKGLARLRKILADLTLDVPAASTMLEEFEIMAKESNCLPKSVAVVE